jgi:hypothetical protein
LNQVASVADAVDDIAFGTAKGPTRFGPLVRAVSAASTMVRVDGPPEPMMIPVRSLDDVFFLEAGILDRLLPSRVIPGRSVAHEPHRAAIDHAGRIERGTAPCTWQRNPSSCSQRA